jgi:hypothetical protein
MKVSQEIIPKLELELTGSEVADFISCLEKLILSEGSAHLGLGILTKSELILAESIIKNYKK